MPLGGHAFEARADGHEVYVYDHPPDRDHIIVAEVFSRKEGHFAQYDLEDVLEDLKTQARRAGGDAIIDMREKRDRHLEASMYIVSAKVIRYTDK